MMSYGGCKSATPEALLEYLQTNVHRCDKGGDCLLWAGAANHGRPVVVWKKKRYEARRLLMEMLGERVRNAHVQWSTCGQPRCMNREHLRSGTKGQCNRATAHRNRMMSGAAASMRVAVARAGTAKLPITERSNVQRMRGEGRTLQQVADHYDVTASRVSKAIRAWDRAYGSVT